MTQSKIELKTIKVLIVDDNPSDREVFKRYMTNNTSFFKYQVFEATSAANAKLTFSTENPDCVLVDYNLPDKNGIELVNMLCVDNKIPSAFVMLTGHGNETIAVKAMSKGFHDYLPKDKVNEYSINRSIKNALDKYYLQQEKDDLIEDLKEANDRMQRFVGIVSHDLRNPLGNITTVTDFLRDSENLNEQKELLDILDNCGKSALNLVHDLLDISALLSGKIKINLKPNDIHQLIQETVKGVEYLSGKKMIDININSSSHMVNCDEKRIIQVINNLLSNAIKFTPEGKSITIETSIENKRIKVQVIDEGVGIDEENIEKLFSKEEKTSTSGTHGETGTGFGLPLSQELIYAHGSKIQVESKLGNGSLFYFYLDSINK